METIKEGKRVSEEAKKGGCEGTEGRERERKRCDWVMRGSGRMKQLEGRETGRKVSVWGK